MANNPSMLIIGEPNSGKTHYSAQLLGRLREKSGRLQLLRTIGDITPLEGALNCLYQGRSAAHTATEIYHEIAMSVGYGNSLEADLLWPDYGGEQIRQLTEQRHINQAWLDRIQQANSWILFLRLSITRTYDDLISRPLHEITSLMPKEAPVEDCKWSDQAMYVELLQLLLFARKSGTLRPVTSPRLLVLLSCWDELLDTDGVTPSELLHRYMPMLADFVGAAWSRDSAQIMGLSAQGKALRPDSSDEGYLEEGPQSFGFVVLPDASQHSDLTLPIAHLLENLR
jgi:hypothetical protein